MKPLDYIILAAVALAFIAAFLITKRKKTRCSGNCASCGKKCR